MPDRSDIVVQLTRAGTKVRVGSGELSHLREQFEKQQCIRLPQLIETERARALLDVIDRSEFFERSHPDAGTPPPVDWCIRDGRISAELSFLLNDTAMLDFVREMTGCPVACFRGVVYRLEPGRSYDAWHDDTNHHRMVAVSINLSRGLFDGGVLQVRETASKRLLCEVANTGLGDATMFRVAPHLQHRVTNVTGTVPRTAFAGWFASEPHFMTLFKGPPRLAS